MYRVSYQDGDSPQTHTFETGEVVIGRSPECQIVLRDFGISRTHAKIVVGEDGVRILDLKSKNGTQVNGVPIVEAPLRDGDRIVLGKFELTFSKALESKVVLDEAKPLPEEAGTIIRSVGELSRLLTAVPTAAPADERKAGAVDVQEIEKSNRILKVLTSIAKTLIAVRPVEEVLQQVMDIVFEHMPADRGFLMLEEEGAKGRLVPMVVKHRTANGEEGRITISKTIADKVMHDRVSILTSDAMVDPRFGSGDSIRFHGIRSAMCAPLWNQDQVIGIIHVDSPMLTNCFNVNDLDMLTALANYAAVAVERARLNQKIVAEEKKRERLGRFLSPQVASRIIAASDAQGAEFGAPEVREVTVLFADIVGFTSMSEKMSPCSRGAGAQRLPLAHDRGDLPLRGHARQVHRRRDHGRLRRAARHAGSRRARDPRGPRDAGAARRVELGAQGRPQPAHPHRDQLRQGGGWRDRQHQQDGVHGPRRHGQHREPAREHRASRARS